MQVDVYLNFNLTHFMELEIYKDNYAPCKSDLEFAGTIEAETLEHAYSLLQHGIDDSALPDSRSLIAGDVLKTDDEYFLVKMQGFKNLSWE